MTSHMNAVRILASSLLALLVFTACTSINDLKPGSARGTIESGFMKTTEGLSLTVRGRSYDDMWAAAVAAMNEAGIASTEMYTGPLTIVDQDRSRGVIRAEETSHFGIIRAYVSIFISPTTPDSAAYVVEVSKILRDRMGAVPGERLGSSPLARDPGEGGWRAVTFTPRAGVRHA